MGEIGDIVSGPIGVREVADDDDIVSHVARVPATIGKYLVRVVLLQCRRMGAQQARRPAIEVPAQADEIRVQRDDSAPRIRRRPGDGDDGPN